MTRDSSGVPSWAARISAPAAVLLATAFLASLQFSFDGFYDGDSYFHTRAARELAGEGVQRTFPQAAFSTWRDRYSDKDFLFHAFLIPFQLIYEQATGRSDLITPGKVAVVGLDFALLSALALGLRLLGARWPGLWIVLLVATQRAVLGHMISVRPHLLGVTLLLLEAALLCRRRVVPLALLAFIHGSTHSSFVLLPLLAACVALVSFLRREAIPWSTLAAVAGGVLAALVVTPYFPNNLFVLWDQTLEVARNVWRPGAEIPRDLFGVELRPASTDVFLTTWTGWAPAAAACFGLLASRPARALSTPALALVSMCGLLLLLSLLSARFLDFFLPLALLLAGCLWTELADGRNLTSLWETRRRQFLAAAGTVLACLAAGLVAASSARPWLVREVHSRSVQRAAVEFLSENVAPDELVYHNFWWDFSLLYHYRPEGRYVVALDPVFMYREDPRRFGRMLEGYRGQARDLHAIVAEDFGARWVFVTLHPWFAPFRSLVQRDSRFRQVYGDRFSEVYEVAPSR